MSGLSLMFTASIDVFDEEALRRAAYAQASGEGLAEEGWASLSQGIPSDLIMLLDLAVIVGPGFENSAAIQRANQFGFAINLSAQTLAQADSYSRLGIAPVVVILPQGTIKPVRTPAGRQVAVCPASLGNIDCLNCGICQQRDRAAIMGFSAHGAGAKRVHTLFFREPS